MALRAEARQTVREYIGCGNAYRLMTSMSLGRRLRMKSVTRFQLASHRRR